MRLKKIELQGFKSFATKTEIEFLDGITTIVGPNGSGKSNVSDAVRWVLGEQSNKVLRSSKMEDIIFAGTENRKKVGFAQVLLTLDNSDKSLPTDFNEVVIGRRIFRSGESSYIINDMECRLKDVLEMFLDTGIGKDGYSIVGQGKIDEILASKSEDRRAIFEEAAGIMKYRVKKEEASRKLVATENNLLRINDILIEIENLIGPLEVKSKKAKEFLNLRDRLKILDVNIFLEIVKENAVKLGELDSKIEILNNDIKLEEEDSLNLEKAKINLKSRLEELLNSIEENQKKFFEMENSYEKLNSKDNVINTEIHNNKEHIKRLTLEIEKNSENIKLLEEEINKKLEKKTDLKLNKKRFEDELKEKENELKQINFKLNNKDIEIEKIKSIVADNLDKINENNIEISSLKATSISNLKQLDNISLNNNSYGVNKDKLNFSKEEIKNKLNEYNKEFNNIICKIEDNSNKLKEYTTKSNDIMNNSSKLKNQILALTSKHTYLTNLEKENEGYFKSVKSVLDYTKKNGLEGVFGTVSSIISTDEKYERAIEIALGTFVQNIIVENESKAKNLIEYLKQNLFGRATFLPLNKLNVRDFIDVKWALKEPNVVGRAIDLCSYDNKYSKVVELALNNTIIVEDLDIANKIFSKSSKNIKIVTLAGEVVSNSGSITGGHTSNKTSSLLGRDDKIKKLEDSIVVKQIEYEKIEDELNVIAPKINEINDIISILKQEETAMNINVATYSEKLKNIELEIEKYISNNEKTRELKENIANHNKDIDININKLNDINLKLEEENNKYNLTISEYNKENIKISKELDVLNEDIVDLKISCASFDESKLSLEEIETKLKDDIDRNKHDNERKDKERGLFAKQVEDFEADKLLILQEKGNLELFKLDYTSLEEKLKQDKKEVSAKIDNLEVEVLSSINKISKLKEEVNKIVNRKSKFEFDIENSKNDIWDNYELTITSAKEFKEKNPIEIDISDVVKEQTAIKDKIKLLGDVDISSIEEFTAQKERLDFIMTQKLDLDETKKKLENLISNMTTIMKSEFLDKFNTINENFKLTFKELFGGGRACVKLTDENNILESGIEIDVQPPGKKLGSMMLLSGGEKALTAIALLFAIMKIKAPPFCILDEIEAALDDINVIRFADYIKNYSDNTQFIIITHRKGTMEVANTVYGVTMEEHGVSKLVSMKLHN